MIQVASAFAHWLAKGWHTQGEQSPREIARVDLTELTQDDVVGAMGYIIEE